MWPPSWAGSRHRVNNQLECFSKHTDPEPPAVSPDLLRGEKSQDPLQPGPTSKLRPRKNKFRAARAPREEAVVREPLLDPTLVNFFLILYRWRRQSLQISISPHGPTSVLLQRKHKGCLLRLFLHHFTWLFKAVAFLPPFWNLNEEERVSRVQAVM